MELEEGKNYKFDYTGIGRRSKSYIIFRVKNSLIHKGNTYYKCKVLYDGDKSATKLNSGEIIKIKIDENIMDFFNNFESIRFTVIIKSKECISDEDTFLYLI